MTYQVAEGVSWIYPSGYVLTAEQVDTLGPDNIAGLVTGGVLVQVEEQKEKPKK